MHSKSTSKCLIETAVILIVRLQGIRFTLSPCLLEIQSIPGHKLPNQLWLSFFCTYQAWDAVNRHIIWRQILFGNCWKPIWILELMLGNSKWGILLVWGCFSCAHLLLTVRRELISYMPRYIIKMDTYRFHLSPAHLSRCGTLPV